MSADPELDLIIIGGGLAGSALWEALARLAPHWRVLLLDDNAPRASDAPGALLHALPGRALVADAAQLRASQHASALLERSLTGGAIAHGEMVRPLVPGKLGARYRSSYLKHRDTYSPALTHALLDDGEDLRARFPHLAPCDGAVVYGPAYMVSLPALLSQWRAPRPGCAQHRAGAVSWAFDGTRWQVRDSAGYTHTAPRIALCLGVQLAHALPALALGVNGGELAVAQPPPDVGALDYMVSAGGHVGARTDGAWVFGATYLRPDQPGATDEDAFARPEEEAILATRALLEPRVPSIARAQVSALWRGRRCVSADKLPVMGRVPGPAGCYAFGALGSRGLLWAPLLADQLARELLGHAPDPDLSATALHRLMRAP